VTAQDNALIEEMVEAIALNRLSVSGAAATIAARHGFASAHDDAVPQRLSRKYRKLLSRHVLHINSATPSKSPSNNPNGEII
jgi:hypothetical protein